MDLDNEHAGYSAIPMDMCPFDDSVASSDESNTAEPPLKAYSNIEHFYSDVFGPLEKHPSSEGQQKKDLHKRRGVVPHRGLHPATIHFK